MFYITLAVEIWEADRIMNNLDWIEMFRVIPPEQQGQIVIVLQNGTELTIDTFFRFEPHFLVARGRVAGTLEENRAFFIPYNQMLYYRLERSIKLEELEQIFGGRPEQIPAVTEVIAPPVVASIAAATVPAPMVGEQTATRNALLERIRAARATQSPNGR